MEHLQLMLCQVGEEHPVEDATFCRLCLLGPHFPDDLSLHLDGPTVCQEADL